MAALPGRFYEGLRVTNGIEGEVAEELWAKITAFAAYGFPESHSQSFASLVYFSAWFKHHYPAEFCVGLLRAQPMGFYSPQSLIQDARRHGVRVLPLSINESGAQATALPTGEIRLGLNLIKGLDTALRGMKTGEDNEFTSTIQSGEHKDEEATIKVHVQQSKERKLPAMDDEFAQMASEFDTMDELRESTKTQVEETKKAEQAAQIRDEVLKAALSEVEFELPQSVVDEQAHSQLHQILGQLAHDEKALAQLLEAQGTSREEFDKQTREQAEESVRTQLFLDAVAEKEEPEVSQQELSDHILFTAQSYGMDPNQFIQQLQSNGQIANLFSDVRRGKALAAAICRTTVKDEEGNDVDVEQYFGEVEEDENEATDAE